MYNATVERHRHIDLLRGCTYSAPRRCGVLPHRGQREAPARGLGGFSYQPRAWRCANEEGYRPLIGKSVQYGSRRAAAVRVHGIGRKAGFGVVFGALRHPFKIFSKSKGSGPDCFIMSECR